MEPLILPSPAVIPLDPALRRVRIRSGISLSVPLGEDRALKDVRPESTGHALVFIGDTCLWLS